MFLVNSRLGHFTATHRRLFREENHDSKHTFFRSYGANLPSSFTRDHSRALECSSRLPVSVCGTVVPWLKLRGFSWQHGLADFVGLGPSTSPLTYTRTGFPIRARYRHVASISAGFASAILLRHPIASRSGTGMLTCFPSTTPFGLALGTD